jgi:hypothetical protein
MPSISRPPWLNEGSSSLNFALSNPFSKTGPYFQMNAKRFCLRPVAKDLVIT